MRSACGRTLPSQVEATFSDAWRSFLRSPSRGPCQTNANSSPRKLPTLISAGSSRRLRRGVGRLPRSAEYGPPGASKGCNPRSTRGGSLPSRNATGWVVGVGPRGGTKTSLPGHPKGPHRPLRERSDEESYVGRRPPRIANLAGCNRCTTRRQSRRGHGMLPARRTLDLATSSEYDSPAPVRSREGTAAQKGCVKMPCPPREPAAARASTRGRCCRPNSSYQDGDGHGGGCAPSAVPDEVLHPFACTAS
jgi:hypothetical protein